MLNDQTLTTAPDIAGGDGFGHDKEVMQARGTR